MGIECRLDDQYRMKIKGSGSIDISISLPLILTMGYNTGSLKIGTH